MLLNTCAKHIGLILISNKDIKYKCAGAKVSFFFSFMHVLYEGERVRSWSPEALYQYSSLTSTYLIS